MTTVFKNFSAFDWQMKQGEVGASRWHLFAEAALCLGPSKNHKNEKQLHI